MKKYFVLLIAMLCLALAACGEPGETQPTACSHDYRIIEQVAASCWKTGYIQYACSQCDHGYKVESPIVAHSFAEATCTDPKTCSACQATEGEANGHSWVDATCTTPKTCSVCQITEGEANEHIWDDGVVVVEPTENNDGEKLYTCTTCGGRKTDIIPAPNHEHSYSANPTPPTCTAEGYTTYTCQCGDSYESNYVPETGHTWIAATCTAPKTCSACQTTEGDALPHEFDCPSSCQQVAEHAGFHVPTCFDGVLPCRKCGDYIYPGVPCVGNWVVQEPPTCTTAGFEVKRCDICGRQEARVLEALGHTWTEATCCTYRTCSVCQTIDFESGFNPEAHSWDDGVVVVEPTENRDGEIIYFCTLCYETKTEIIPAPNHTHTYTTKIVAPTCTEEGYTIYTCACGDSYTADSVPALGTDHTWIEATCSTYRTCSVCQTIDFESGFNPEAHSWDDGVVVVEPTEYSAGAELFTCTACEVTNVVIIPVLDHTHSYTPTITPPTCTGQGYTTYTCACGDSYVDDYVEVLDHDYQETARENGVVTYTCTVCGDSYDENLTTDSVGLEYEKNSDGTYTVVGLGTCTDLDVVIPEVYEGAAVTAIGDKAFAEETAITSIQIPDSVKSIGTRAFYGCSGITEITIPASVKSIGTQIFYKCSALHTVYYNGTYGDDENPFLSVANIKKVVFGGKTIPSYVCYSASNLTEVVILDSVTRIGSYAFYGCSRLTSATIPDSVTSIPREAFRNCSSLTSIVIPDSVTIISDEAFSFCSSLTSVYITDIEAWCGISFSSSRSNPLFYGAALYLNGELMTDLVIPDSITRIGNNAFYGCISLTSITIPDSVTSIDYNAFNGCESLTSITIPDSVTSIGDLAFNGCTNLNSVFITDLTAWCSIKFHYSNSNPLCHDANLYLDGELVTDLVIPDSVTSIGNYAFNGCESLTSITIPDSVTSIGKEAFSCCSSLSGIWVDSANPNYASDNQGVLLNKDKTILVQAPGGISEHYDIPASVISIDSDAFYGCSSLTSITIPDSVTSIGSCAFYCCRSLTDIHFGGTKEQWKAIPKYSAWDSSTGDYTVHCIDGDISK